MLNNYKILHLFQWRLNDIVPQLSKIKEQGFNTIQISPIQKCREGYEWWKLYQPFGYEIGNRIGSEEDLKLLCAEADKFNIEIIADVLLRNVASDENGNLHELVDDKIKQYIDDTIPQCANWENRYESTHFKIGLPLVPYWNEDIQQMHIEFLDKLADLGVSGLRLDMAKHIATPDEGCSYLTNVLRKFKDYLFIYGEVLNASREVLDMYSNYMFVGTESHMNMTNKNKKVTFFESHDNYFTLKNTHYLTKDQMLYEWNQLVNVKKRNAIFFVRPIEDQYGLSNIWMSEEIKNINNGV